VCAEEWVIELEFVHRLSNVTMPTGFMATPRIRAATAPPVSTRVDHVAADTQEPLQTVWTLMNAQPPMVDVIRGPPAPTLLALELVEIAQLATLEMELPLVLVSLLHNHSSSVSNGHNSFSFSDINE